MAGSGAHGRQVTVWGAAEITKFVVLGLEPSISRGGN
jgi:hypothetical protein